MNQRVVVEWRDPANDWHWFRLLDLHGDWVLLKGTAAPDGTKHTGGLILVHRSEIAGIYPVKKGEKR